MSNDIDEKVKGVAILGCIVLIVGSIFGCIMLCINKQVFSGIIVAILGIALAICSCILLLGFGELISRAISIDEKLNNNDSDLTDSNDVIIEDNIKDDTTNNLDIKINEDTWEGILVKDVIEDTTLSTKEKINKIKEYNNKLMISEYDYIKGMKILKNK